MFAFFCFVFLAILPLLSTAQLVPTAPGPGETFKQGSPCSISWTADTSGKWKNTFIELMTGSNDQMTHLSTVANVDGTDPANASISIPCPSVSPHAPIYFYQFTALHQPPLWTTRFTISDPTGATSPAPNPTQPNGGPIPWGVGQLASQGSPPPPTAPSGQIDGSNPASASASASASTASTLAGIVASQASAPASTPLSTPPSPSIASPASASVASSVPAPALSSALSSAPLTPSAAAPASPASTTSAAITNSLSAAPALVAAAMLGLVYLY